MANIRTALMIALAAWAWHPSCAITLSDIAGQVSINSYSNFHIGLFVSDGNSRGFTHTGTVRVPAYQHDQARDFIASSFQSMGFDTWLDPFAFSKSGNLYTNCNNVVAVKHGSGGSNIFIVGAHYDSVDLGDGYPSLTNPYCPGADDNASGVAALLETAKTLQSYTFRDTVILIAFDAEEKGYEGAIHFLADHVTTDPAQTNGTRFLKEAIKGMMSVDTIAYDDPSTPRQIMIGSVGKEITSPIDLALAQAATHYSLLAPIHGKQWGESDHYPFHKAGIDAALLIESDFFDYANPSSPTFRNPYYHSASDSIDSPGYIDYGYATEVAKIIVGYLCDEARAVPPATLNSAMQSNAVFSVGWQTSPGVAYALYGTASLMDTNGWQFMELFEDLEGVAEFSVQLDTQNAARKFYKVESR